jgi:hypothetical protein
VARGYPTGSSRALAAWFYPSERMQTSYKLPRRRVNKSGHIEAYFSAELL